MHSIVASRKNGEDILISGSNDCVCFWRIGETSSFDMITPKAGRFIYCLAGVLKKDGSSILACGYENGIIELWDINQMKVIKELNNSESI